MTQLATEMAGDESAVGFIEQVASMKPGPGAMALLNDIDMAALTDEGRVEVTRLWQMQQGWVFAQAQAALAAVDSSPGECDREWRQDLVAAALGWSPRTAGTRLHNAATVMTDFPVAHQMLAAGELMPGHIWVLLDETVSLSAEDRRRVETRVIERAPNQSVAQFARTVRRAALAVDPHAAAAAVKRAIADRNVRKEMRVDGMAAVVATLPAADAEVVYRALDACARKTLAGLATDDPPPIGALRADALTAWAERALAEPGLPLQHGRRVEVQVVIDLATALGLADNPASWWATARSRHRSLASLPPIHMPAGAG